MTAILLAAAQYPGNNGVYPAYRFMVRELMRRSGDLGVKYMVASGGDAEFFCRHIPELEAAGKLFTLQGISFIAAKHTEKE